MADRSSALHRFFVEPATLASDEVEVRGPQAHQMARVLRLQVGEQIILLDGSGLELVVELIALGPSVVRGMVRETRPNRGEARLQVLIYQAVIARERFEFVLQKGTEVGAWGFVPVWCERSEPRGDGIDGGRLERWRRIVQEAAEQSGRGRLPEVRAPMRLPEALVDATAAGPTLLAWEGERQRSVRAALRALFAAPDLESNGPLSDAPPAPDGVARLSLFIGPVGGFAPTEVAEARERGAELVSLGPRILRTETAGPVLAALALYERGDLDADNCPSVGS